MFTLADDGTLDTVVECESCGRQVRYSYAAHCDDGRKSAEDDEFAYDRFVEWALGDAAEDHECEDVDEDDLA